MSDHRTGIVFEGWCHYHDTRLLQDSTGVCYQEPPFLLTAGGDYELNKVYFECPVMVAKTINHPNSAARVMVGDAERTEETVKLEAEERLCEASWKWRVL